jgi:predicted secreted protein
MRSNLKELGRRLKLNKLGYCFVVLLLVALCVSPAMAETPGDFTDIDGHWAQGDITAVTNLGLMSGMENGTGVKIFTPGGSVTRAQLASVVYRLFELDYGNLRFVKQPQASDYYQDIDNKAWYADAVMLCAINHVFDAGDKFYPDREVTRIEVAQAIYRAVNAKGLSIPMIMLMPDYHDIEGLSQEATNALVFASNTGLMKGDNQYWRPHDKITRAELAGVINRCLKLIAVSESDNGQEYSLSPGSTLNLMLDSNPTTGYRWIAAYDDEMLALVGKDYQNNDQSSNLLGEGGRDLWRFKALKAGQTELKMTYARPWESLQPLKTFTLTVIISPEPNH